SKNSEQCISYLNATTNPLSEAAAGLLSIIVAWAGACAPFNLVKKAFQLLCIVCNASFLASPSTSYICSRGILQLLCLFAEDCRLCPLEGLGCSLISLIVILF